MRRRVRRAAAGPGAAGRCRCRRPPATGSRGQLARPAPSEVKPLDWKLLGWTFSDGAGVRADGVGVVGQPRCGWWCPTSRSRTPVEAIRSASRNPSPISTISPRLTTHLAAGGERRRGQHQGGGAVVDRPALLGAGHRAPQRRDGAAAARRPPPGRQVELDVDVPGGRDRAPRRAAADSGARPRLVCSTTPVALITGVQGGGRAGSAATRRVGDRGRGDARTAAPVPGAPVTALPDRCRHRAAGRGLTSRGSASTTSVRGTDRRGSGVIAATGSPLPHRVWRRRTGIEPAKPRCSASPVLKTGRATRRLYASAGDGSRGVARRPRGSRLRRRLA